MKKIYLILAVIGVLLLVGYLHYIGVIKTSWQWLSIILAALAGPYKLLENSIKSSNPSLSSKAQEILKRQGEVDKQEQIIRQQYEALLNQKQLEIEELRARLQRLEDQLEKLQLERKQIKSEVESMSLEEKSQQFNDYFGT